MDNERAHSDGELPSGHVESNPAVGDVPCDLEGIGYTALGNKLEQLVHSTDRRSEIDAPEQLIPWNDRSLLTKRRTALKSLRDQAQPRVSTNIEPWAMHYMDSSPSPFSSELLKEASTSLSEKGSSKKRLLAGEGRAYIDQSKDGHQEGAKSYSGNLLIRGDFDAQELSIARFQFQVIDFGDTMPIQDAMIRSTGNFENVGRNQCVLLHLASGMLWDESGRHKRAPGRGGVSTLVQELRRMELKNALLATEALQEDTSLEGAIVKSNARDARRPSHDRYFRTLRFFLSSVLLGLKTGCLRIFDLRMGTNGYDVSVHLFSNVSGGNGTAYIDLIAHRRHMRLGKLVDDTRPKDLTNWQTAFSSVVRYPILGWSEFVQNPTDSDVISPTPCIY